MTKKRKLSGSKAGRSERERDPYDGMRFYSALTHGIGAALAAVGTALLLAMAVRKGLSLLDLNCLGVYGASLMALYAASTAYHSLNTGISGRLLLRRLDHCMIYVLIAGTYTPVCLIALGGTGGRALFIVIWALAAAGMLGKLLWMKAPRWLTSGLYIAMGWLVLAAAYPLSQSVPIRGLLLLVAGGVAYTAGGVLYALKWPGRDNPRFGAHEVFHLFCVAGSFLHYLMIYQMVLAL